MKRQAKITLVGAGPGNPELITVKGLKALQSADVVLYDALSNPALLVEAPATAIKIYVGKRANNHRYTQDEINLLMVQHAFTYGHVVRLKGGDPFIFGRGHEELVYTETFGIKTAVVPGISSCIAVPELQGIPLTRRGVNESFWVITGTTSSGEISKDIALAAQSSATVVILMGTRKLAQIVDIFARAGQANTPVMVIQNGSTPNERMVHGAVSNIHQKVQQAGLGAPAIIVIGAVVDLHPERQEELAAIVRNYQ